MVRQSFWTWSALVVVIVAGGIWGWREYCLRRLPFDAVLIPPIEYRERLEIPPRPGIQGIVITGPTIESLFFSIDLTKAGVRSLDWRRLQAIDPHADVKVNCRIGDQGQLWFSQDDVLMGGHTEAGMIIQRTLKTWMYTPFKTGVIRFWFNLPSKGRKLIIDTSGLRRKPQIPEYVPIYDGKIHLVDGLENENIWVGGRF